jgi:hypothetical protein
VLKVDEMLLELSGGKTGEFLEKAIAQLSNPLIDEKPDIWGTSMSIPSLVMDEARMEPYIEKLITQYWSELNLFLIPELEHTNMDLQTLNSRLQQYITSPSGKARLLQYIKINNRLQYQQFLSLIFDKEIDINPKHTGLVEIVCFTVKDKFLVQGIFAEQESFWRTLYAKKMYSILRQVKLEAIEQPIAFIRCFKQMLQAKCTANRSATIVHKLTVELDYYNPKSFELKQLHLLNIVNHYLSGRRSLQRLAKCIDQFTRNWSSGNFAITEKEQTLLYYLLFMRAAELKKEDELLRYAYELIEDEKLNTHSVEIFFEFGEILKLVQPMPLSIVKNNAEHYLEHVYALILQAFVEHQLYDDALHLLKQFELASCTSIYEVLNGSSDEAALAKIEATVQRDITAIMKKPANEMMDALTVWKQNYLNNPHHLSKIAKSTVKHIHSILKVLFITEQFDCFEKLMEVYKKYLEIPSYTNSLKQFIQDHLEKESNEMVTI